jgi:tripartite-type tricarboxylate transporter receptor subunit TctC
MKQLAQVLLCSLGALCVAASAQTYPTRSIRVVSNAASGSPGDIALRLVSPKVSAALGQPVVVETKGGGGGQIAAQDVIRGGPDGYTLLYSSSMIATSKFLLKNVTIDLHRDLVPISMSARTTNLIAVHSSVPASSLKELVDYSKRNPGKLSFSSNGIGSSLHLQFIGFMLSTGADLFHVPYGTANEGLRNNDFLTGRTSVSLIPYSSIKPALDSGAVRALAVLSDSRYKRLPDLPAVTEPFPDYRLSLGFWGFFGPAGLPQPVVARVSGEIQKGYRDAEIVAKLDAIDVEAVGSTPQQFAAFLKGYESTVASIVKTAGLEPQ